VRELHLTEQGKKLLGKDGSAGTVASFLSFLRAKRKKKESGIYLFVYSFRLFIKSTRTMRAKYQQGSST
jgi:hypothetical protein